MKKGRHRRFEEARALKRSDDLDFDSILSSLDSEEASIPEDEGDSPAFDTWASEFEEDTDEEKVTD